MKSTKDFRNIDSGETMRRAAKLEPIRKSGKEKQQIYRGVNTDDDEDLDYTLSKRESVFDYMDDDED